jgi:hypothetical protein
VRQRCPLWRLWNRSCGTYHRLSGMNSYRGPSIKLGNAAAVTVRLIRLVPRLRPASSPILGEMAERYGQGMMVSNCHAWLVYAGCGSISWSPTPNGIGPRGFYLRDFPAFQGPSQSRIITPRIHPSPPIQISCHGIVENRVFYNI